MSYGLTPYELVQRVYYVQEKVILDFWPDDDKFKEVIMEANLVLEELQGMEDWHWLRDTIELGTTDHCHGAPEFELPDWVYKPATMHGDCVKLICPHGEHNSVNVPIVSQGRLRSRNQRSVQGVAVVQPELPLSCSLVGDTVVFNRELLPYEAHRIVTMDVQRRIEPIHMCSDSCDHTDGKNVCKLAYDQRVLTEVPDPNYIVYRTAALHAEGSPMAQGRLASLQDVSTKLLSQMRENNYSVTDPDYIEYERSYFVDVV